MVNRRGFIGALAAVAAAPFLPALPVAAPVKQGLMFHPNAFALTMGPVNYRFDVLYGSAVLQPNFACRLVNDEPFRASDGYRGYLAQDAVIQARTI